MSDRASDGPAVAHLRIPHLAGDVSQHRCLMAQDVADLEVTVAGQGADHHVVAVLADVRQVRQAADVDQEGRGGQPELHQRQQRVTPCQQLGIIAVLAQEAHRLVDGLGPLIFERRWNHAETPAALAAGTSAAARMALTMLW